jgi:hypothetical protein
MTIFWTEFLQKASFIVIRGSWFVDFTGDFLPICGHGIDFLGRLAALRKSWVRVHEPRITSHDKVS